MRYVIVAILAVLMLSACGSSGSDKAACKAAMKKDFAVAMTNPSAPPASEPPACKGIPDKELEKLAEEVMSGQ